MAPTVTINAVVSPAGVVHAVRSSASRTACGLNYLIRTRRRNRREFLGWVVVISTFYALADRGQAVCSNCVENLDLGIGPL